MANTWHACTDFTQRDAMSLTATKMATDAANAEEQVSCIDLASSGRLLMRQFVERESSYSLNKAIFLVVKDAIMRLFVLY